MFTLPQIDAERRRAAGYQEELKTAKENHFNIVSGLWDLSDPRPPPDARCHDSLIAHKRAHPPVIDLSIIRASAKASGARGGVFGEQAIQALESAQAGEADTGE